MLRSQGWRMNACNMLWHSCVDAQAAFEGVSSISYIVLRILYLGYFGFFWSDRIFYVKRKVESIREDHSSIPSLLFRWTQQSDEWQKPQHGTQAARSGVTNRSGSMAEDMVTMLASLVEEVLSILLFFSIWRVWKLCPNFDSWLKHIGHWPMICQIYTMELIGTPVNTRHRKWQKLQAPKSEKPPKLPNSGKNYMGVAWKHSVVPWRLRVCCFLHHVRICACYSWTFSKSNSLMELIDVYCSFADLIVESCSQYIMVRH